MCTVGIWWSFYLRIHIKYKFGAMFIIFPPVAPAPTNLMAVQEGPTSIRVSWSPPTPLGNTTGYRIYYSGGSSGSVNASTGSTYHLLTGLLNGGIYTISIVTLATTSSRLLPSDTVRLVNIRLGMNKYIHYAVLTLRSMVARIQM